MPSDIVLAAKSVSKKFCKNLRRSMYYGAGDVLRCMIGIRVDTHVLRQDEFWAIHDVNFALRRGETLALMGSNGSGKSTLLRVLNGIYEPDAGRIEIRGRIGALIGLGAGFHPLMTGRENIYLNGTILGMTKQDIHKRLDDIVEFADLGEFLDTPVKTYSSGMQMRLGFAIAIQANPDILIVDEVLAVGDTAFQKKCVERILEIIRRGTAMIFVSHSIGMLEALCRRGILLKRGRQIFWGSVRDCVERYVFEIGEDNVGSGVAAEMVGIGDVIITNCYAYQTGCERTNRNIEFGKDFVIEFDYKFMRKADKRNQVRVGIRTYEGHDVQKLFFQETPFGDGKVYANETIVSLKKEGTIAIRVLSPRLFPQTFRVDIAISHMDMALHLGGIANAVLFNVVNPVASSQYFEYGNMATTQFDFSVVAS